MQTQSVTHFYGEDHERLDELFHRFQSLKGASLREALDNFKQFSDGLLQHIAWEEQILFPAFEQRTGMHSGGPTAAMRREHQQIQSLLGLISLELQRGEIATDGEETELRSVLSAHNLKEEHILYPAIDQMLSEPERSDIFACMGAKNESAIELDVRDLPPVRQHELIFQTFEALDPGAAFVLVNDHDPKPLCYQFGAEHSGQFIWDYLERGPEVWRVRIGKAARLDYSI